MTLFVLPRSPMYIYPCLFSLQAFSFFNTIAYQVGGDVFTLAELEHNILRAPSFRPR